ncbi:type IV toxin-antitoxin system AbiEi family antitoxin domain-containing protein [Curtanaerobium respiraculi]|uniref:type IV toxin-antitoxin system AbiEi family antitoxin domain-containing protein n=1 Tax=Curtanaerobium respiraculi TaxID=2949669 RepID=UPI0024B37CCB|nr:type IV toxin-antitoxin system AbiEi family antitoxin domain-containing protein [Curtanaerobium respiraculi]
MTHYETIYETAADNYGIVTAAQARGMGISYKEMNALASRGMIERRGHGVYKLTHWVPTPNDHYAEAVALVGPGAYLWGDAVLAMHGLAFVNPRSLTIASPRRVRRELPPWVRVVPGVDGEAVSYEGIPSQSIPDAIRACRGRVMPDRLEQAVCDARREGLITQEEAGELLNEAGDGWKQEAEQQAQP